MKNIKTKTNPRAAVKKNKTSVKKISLKIDKKTFPLYLAKVAVLVLVIGALYYFRGQFIVATVNGKPVTRVALIKELETQSGNAALNGMIVNILVLQEGKKQGIVITDQQVSDEIEAISQNLATQGQNLDVALAAQGITRKSLEKQIRIQKTAEGVVSKDISITEEEIDQYIVDNKDYIPTDMAEEDVRANSKQQLKQEKMSSLIQTLVERLQKEAGINHLFYKN